MERSAALVLYERLVATNPGVERKGDTMPYTSLNGHMFSVLHKDGTVALRLPAAAREAFLKKFRTRLSEQYGSVQPEYVVVPDTLLSKTRELKPYFDMSFAYVGLNETQADNQEQTGIEAAMKPPRVEVRRQAVTMITHKELVLTRETLLERTVASFVAQPDVIGIFLAGSLPAGSADAYSDIDLRVIATPEGQARLVAGRLEWPAQWGDLLFNEWLDGAQHCVSHFRPFVKIDVFYWTPEIFRPSPWFKFPARVFLDRTGLVERVLAESRELTFSAPASADVSRVLSKALAGTHEVVRRARRGELFYAQSLLDELRASMARLDAWIQGFQPSVPHDLTLTARVSPSLARAFERSYVGLNPDEIDGAVVGLSAVLAQQVSELHRTFDLKRPLTSDLHAVDLVLKRQVA